MESLKWLPKIKKARRGETADGRQTGRRRTRQGGTRAVVGLVLPLAYDL